MTLHSEARRRKLSGITSRPKRRLDANFPIISFVAFTEWNGARFEILEPQLERLFFLHSGGFRKVNKSWYLVDTKTRLSIAILFFAGANPCNIMQVHEVSLIVVYCNIWGLVETINACEVI